MSGNGTKYEIKKIEYCPSACGQPHIVTVERTLKQNGEETTKEISCQVYMNHIYQEGKFIQKTSISGEPWDYQKHNFENPVKSIISTNGIGNFVEAEFKRRFQEQRGKEGW